VFFLPGSGFLFSPFDLASFVGVCCCSGIGPGVASADFSFSGGLLFGSGAGGSELLSAALFASGSPSLVKP